MARRPLHQVLAKLRPDLADPVATIEAGEVLVEGAIVTNPNSQVLVDARIVVKRVKELKGESKLALGIEALGGVDLAGRVALDCGASTGGFTTELLRRGVARVYAVDVGHGQLMGALRQDPRVVNLENTNATDLTLQMVPEALGAMTIDISYSPLRAVLPGVTAALDFVPGAVLVALIKPMFELQVGELPTSTAELESAVMVAEQAIRGAGWNLDATVESPLRGNNGAVEYFAMARLLG